MTIFTLFFHVLRDKGPNPAEVISDWGCSLYPYTWASLIELSMNVWHKFHCCCDSVRIKWKMDVIFFRLFDWIHPTARCIRKSFFLSVCFPTHSLFKISTFLYVICHFEDFKSIFVSFCYCINSIIFDKGCVVMKINLFKKVLWFLLCLLLLSEKTRQSVGVRYLCLVILTRWSLSNPHRSW